MYTRTFYILLKMGVFFVTWTMGIPVYVHNRAEAVPTHKIIKLTNRQQFVSPKFFSSIIDQYVAARKVISSQLRVSRK